MGSFIDDLTNSTMSKELELILVAASDLNIEDRNSEIEKINVLQSFEDLKKKGINIPNEAASLRDNKDAKFIIWLNNFCQEHLKRADGARERGGRSYSEETKASLKELWCVSEMQLLQKTVDIELDLNKLDIPSAFDAIARAVYSGMPIFINRIMEKSKPIIVDDYVS